MSGRGGGLKGTWSQGATQADTEIQTSGGLGDGEEGTDRDSSQRKVGGTGTGLKERMKPSKMPPGFYHLVTGGCLGPWVL